MGGSVEPLACLTLVAIPTCPAPEANSAGSSFRYTKNVPCSLARYIRKGEAIPATDQAVVFGCQAGRYLAENISQMSGIPLGAAEIFKFPNDNKFVRIHENVRERDVFVVQTSCPPVDEALMEALIMIDALRRASARRITAVLPYFPYARSDKKDQPRVPITARLVADLLTTAGADRVVTVDLTADQIQGFFGNILDHLTAMPLFIRAAHDLIEPLCEAVVVAPDAGTAKRALKFADLLGIDLAGMVFKRRIAADGAVSVSTAVTNVRDKPVLLIDDEIDTANSLTHAAAALMECGARSVVAFCTHGVLSHEAVARVAQSPLIRVVVTDTVPVPTHDKLTVVPISPLLAEAIDCIHTGRSLSALFEVPPLQR